MSTLLMVSGASRGLGQAISIALAGHNRIFQEESCSLSTDRFLEAVLLSRSPATETSRRMEAVRPFNLNSYQYSLDLGDLETLEESMEPIFQRHMNLLSTGEKPTKAILINCAGTIGFIGRRPASLLKIQQAVDLNFTSKAWLSTQFIDTFGGCEDVVVVNVSSMCAIKPTPTMGLYCATSASREIFHATLAMDNPRVRILNYSPGSCNTGIQEELRKDPSLDPAVQRYCQSLVTDGGLVSCEDTAESLAERILSPNGFHSGERVEYVNISAYKY